MSWKRRMSGREEWRESPGREKEFSIFEEEQAHQDPRGDVLGSKEGGGWFAQKVRQEPDEHSVKGAVKSQGSILGVRRHKNKKPQNYTYTTRMYVYEYPFSVG